MNIKRVIKSGIGVGLLVLLSACSTTEPVSDKTVNYRYQNVEFEPSEQSIDVDHGVSITLKPVDVNYLNRMSHESALRTGEYEQEYYLVLEEREDELDDLTRSERESMEVMIEATEQIESALTQTHDYRYDIMQRVLYRMWHGPEVGYDGSEEEMVIEEAHPSIYNPFIIDGRALSVFEVQMENQSDDVGQIKLQDFQVQSGFETLEPLGTSYFEETLRQPSIKYRNLLRFKMSEEVNITSGSSTRAYFAVPAINIDEQEVHVNYISDQVSGTFSFDISEQQIEESYTLNGYRIVPDQGSGYDMEIYAIRYDGRIQPLQEDTFYLPDEEGAKTVDICGVALSSSLPWSDEPKEGLGGCNSDINLPRDADEKSEIQIEFRSLDDL